MVDEGDAKPWRWVAVWWTDASFWRDVASRTLSAVIAGVLAYGGALLLGYVKKPDDRHLIIGVLAALVGVAALTAWAMFLARPGPLTLDEAYRRTARARRRRAYRERQQQRQAKRARREQGN